MNDERKPAFIITIDAEGDNLWEFSASITTKNARYLPRFQDLCERHQLKPTWLTNYEMAEDPFFCEFASDLMHRNQGEIGMHLHAWNSPPVTSDGPEGQAYLIEYPVNVMSAKIKFMTDFLAERFRRKPVSHRSGRWALNSSYARLLVEYGYRIDCSVTPHVSWINVLGDPKGSGGTDYTAYPAKPYFMNLDQLDREGDSSLLEVPVSIVRKSNPPHSTSWLRPNGDNRNQMIAILHQALDEEWQCVEFMLHSSELMPEGSPTFKTFSDIEMLYEDLDALFSEASGKFQGMTLNEFYDR
jgi:hypothetical protein